MYDVCLTHTFHNVINLMLQQTWTILTVPKKKKNRSSTRISLNNVDIQNYICTHLPCNKILKLTYQSNKLTAWKLFTKDNILSTHNTAKYINIYIRLFNSLKNEDKWKASTVLFMCNHRYILTPTIQSSAYNCLKTLKVQVIKTVTQKDTHGHLFPINNLRHQSSS